VICITDADTLIDPDALLRAVWPFVDEPLTVAVGGTICIANGSKVHRGRVVEARLPRNFLALVQALEYQRAFMLARVGLSRLGALLIVSGAFGLFRRDAVMAVGGYSLGTVGEDLDLVVKLHRHFRERALPYVIRFLAEPVVWTQAPESLGDLARQRARWERGALECLPQPPLADAQPALRRGRADRLRPAARDRRRRPGDLGGGLRGRAAVLGRRAAVARLLPRLPDRGVQLRRA
jgi:cellulose synthase/poly-beta-1,6-N-acetylglucosamine synthase-like glycosyltransferase